MKKYPIRVKVDVLQQDIDEGKCKNPNLCMDKLAIKRAIKCPHGYIKVANGRVSITRRPDYRERADLPQKAIDMIALFDENPKAVKPHSFWLTFRKTTKVVKRDKERVNKNRRENNQPSRYRKYNLHERVAGLAVDKEHIKKLAWG